MQVSKWGNSLAVRIPSAVVKALELKEGDDIEISIAGRHELKINRNRKREEALERLRRSNWTLPPGWKFDREEANER
jgi:antitoxin MazE